MKAMCRVLMLSLCNIILKIPGWGVSGNFREISEDFPEILRDGRDIHIDIVKRQIKIFIIGLQKNNPEIMSDPPVEYLRNINFSVIIRFFPTGFMYRHNFYTVRQS